MTWTSLRSPLAAHDSVSGTDSSRSSADGPAVTVAVAVRVAVPVAVGGSVAVGDGRRPVDEAVADADLVAGGGGDTVFVGPDTVTVLVGRAAGVAVAPRSSSSSPHPPKIAAARQTVARTRVTASLDRIQPF